MHISYSFKLMIVVLMIAMVVTSGSCQNKEDKKREMRERCISKPDPKQVRECLNALGEAASIAMESMEAMRKLTGRINAHDYYYGQD